MRAWLLALALAALLAGCGGGDDDGGDGDAAKRVPADAVALVGEEPISKGEFDHWLAAVTAQQAPPGSDREAPEPGDEEYDTFRDQVMQFLVSAEWLEQEAAAQDVSVREAAVRASFEEQKEESFPKESDYEEFLESSEQSEADLLYRVRLELLADALREKAGKKGGGEEGALDRFVEEFRGKYRERTVCAEDFETEVCSNGPEPTADQ